MDDICRMISKLRMICHNSTGLLVVELKGIFIEVAPEGKLSFRPNLHFYISSKWIFHHLCWILMIEFN